MIVITLRQGDDAVNWRRYEEFTEALDYGIADPTTPEDSRAYARELLRYDQVKVTLKTRADTLITWLKTLPGSGCLRVKCVEEPKRRYT